MLEDARSQEKRAHWESVYQTKQEAEVSWHQDNPALSLDLIREIATPRSRIIDVGGGSSVLASRLVALGFEDVAVLDISAAALDRAKERGGTAAEKVRWVIADVTAVRDLGQFDVWHDRAVFHFLTSPEERRSYVELAARTVPAGGRLIVGTFALDGPEKCSGLPVERYDTAKLSDAFGASFSLRREAKETHLTPWGKPQQFTYAVFERTAVEKIDAGTLRHWLDAGRPVVVVDVRGEDDRAGGTIPGSVHFNAIQALKSGDADAMNAFDVPPGACVVTVCNLGHAAGTAARLLRERGIDAVSLGGGMSAWAAAGKPSDSTSHERRPK